MMSFMIGCLMSFDVMFYAFMTVHILAVIF